MLFEEDSVCTVKVIWVGRSALGSLLVGHSGLVVRFKADGVGSDSIRALAMPTSIALLTLL
jgi:hypothetical protein